MSDTIITNYREARAKTRDALQRGVLDAAGRVLVQEGYTALTMRRVADEVGAWTKVLYTLFASKDGLINALYLTAIQRMRAALEAVPLTEPLADLYALADAYRAHMLRQPNDYLILFGLSLPGFTPSEAARAENLASFAILIGALERAITSGALRPCDLESEGKAVIAQINGMISFEVAGYMTDPDAGRYYRFGLETVLRGLGA
jgi:AcrR family transcriptional regulator